MSTPANGEDFRITRVDRILAFIALGLLVLSIVCFFAIIIATAAHADFSAPIWHVVGTLVYIAPILTIVLILIVIISSFVRRGRANRGS